MKEMKMLSILERLSWRCDKDEARDYFCLMDIGEVQIQVIPTIGKRSDYFKVLLMPSVSTKNFMVAVAFVLGETSNYVPIIVSDYVPEKVIDFSLDDVVRLSQSAISWASTQDIGRDLTACRALPASSKGAMPSWHLTALAVAGDVSCLADYQFSFEQGDRLGFVPYITRNMIERALLIARNVR